MLVLLLPPPSGSASSLAADGTHTLSLATIISANSAGDAVSAVQRYFESNTLYFGHGALSARDEAGWLVFAICDLDHAAPEAGYEYVPKSAELAEIARLAERRVSERQPLAYLLGEAWFAGLRFEIDPAALIPRSPLAELVAQGFTPWLAIDDIESALEIGTGSGCIAVALAVYWPALEVVATDISSSALTLAQRNAVAHQVDDRVTLHRADVYDGLPPRRYDLIVSNPPYVSAASMKTLPAEYMHEPAQALVAGDDGLDVVRRLLARAPDFLTEHGVLIVEVGESQARFDAAFESLAVTWLEFSDGDSGVLLLTRPELVTWLARVGALE